MIELSPEMLLLLACCRTNREDSGETEIHRLIDNPPDWVAFYRLAKNHKVPPTVYRDLLQYAGDRIPADISGKFKKQADMHKIRALKASAQMIDLPGLFEKKQLPLIFLKGPALAALLYGDISSRHTGDIDVLVESRDIEAIHELLSRNEYQTGDGNFFLSPAYRKAFSDANHHIAYSHKRGVVAEFHYRLFRNPYLFHLSPGDSPLPYRDYNFPGATIRLLPDIEHFLFLFVHGAIHKWRSLKWLIDIARLLDSPAVFDDWERLFDRAREMGVERMVIQGLLLAKWLLDCPFPPAIAHHITGHKGVKLAFDALNELDGRKELPKKKGSIRKVLGKIFYRMKLRKGLKYKLYNLEILFSINSHNQKLMLPSYLYPFRFLLSPLLLGYRRCFKRKKT